MEKRGENEKQIWLKHIILHARNSQQKFSKEYQHLKVIIRTHIEFKRAWTLKVVIEFIDGEMDLGEKNWKDQCCLAEIHV